MTTPLHGTLKRTLTIEGRDYVLALSATNLKLTLKGKRNGVELSWSELVSGEAALAVALHASLGAFAAKQQAAPTASRSADSAAVTPKSKPQRRTAKPARKK
jgi:hypothetical protein